MSAKVLLTNKNSSWGIINNINSPNEFRHSIAFPDISKRDEFVALELFGDSLYDWKSKINNQPEFGFSRINSMEAVITIREKDYPNFSRYQLMNKDYAVVYEDGEYTFWSLTQESWDGEANITFNGSLDIPFTYNILYNLKNEFLLKKTQMKEQFSNADNFEIENKKITNLENLVKYEDVNGSDTNIKFIYYKKQLIDEDGLIIKQTESSYRAVSVIDEIITTNHDTLIYETPIINPYNEYQWTEFTFTSPVLSGNKTVRFSSFDITVGEEEVLYSFDETGNNVVYFTFLDEDTFQLRLENGIDGFELIKVISTNGLSQENGLTVPAPFTLHLIPITENNQYTINGTSYTTSNSITKIPDDSSVVEAKVLEYNPIIYNNDINNTDINYDEGGILNINVTPLDPDDPQIIDEDGIIKVNFINTNYSDSENQYQFYFSSVEIPNIEKQMIQNGIVDWYFGYYGTDKKLKIPYDLFKNGNISLQMRLEVLDSLAVNVDILDYSKNEIGIKDIYQDFPFNTDNFETYKTNNKGNVISKWIAFSLLGIGGVSMLGKGLYGVSNFFASKQLLKDLKSGAVTSEQLDYEGMKNYKLPGMKQVGLGAATALAIPMFFGNAINLKNQPNEIIPANTQTSINLLQMGKILSVWMEIPQNEITLNRVNTFIERTGSEYGDYVDDVFYLGEKKYYQYFEIIDTFENINLELSTQIKQQIDTIFEQGITFWYYRSEETWNGIKNYKVTNEFLT